LAVEIILPNIERFKIMKIKIEMTVDIDVDSWVLNYGTELNDVRDDVKGYVKNIVLGQLEVIDVLAEGDK
jgi:hypothetical protein